MTQIETCAWSPFLLRSFVTGDVTLAELEGASAQTLQELAKIAYFYFEQRRHDVAEKLFRALHAFDPFDSYFASALGAIAQCTGELTQAEALYSVAIAGNPCDTVAYANRGDVRLQLNRFGEGLADLEKAAALDPQNKEVTAPRTQTLLRAFRPIAPAKPSK